MKKLQENINRIKELMLAENDDQLSLFSGDDGKPININSDEFTKRFKEKVYFILNSIKNFLFHKYKTMCNYEISKQIITQKLETVFYGFPRGSRF